MHEFEFEKTLKWISSFFANFLDCIYNIAQELLITTFYAFLQIRFLKTWNEIEIFLSYIIMMYLKRTQFS